MPGQLGVRTVPLSEELSGGLKSLAQRAGVPLKSVLLAAHVRVMGLVGNQTDVLTGLVSNSRPEEADGERVLGLFPKGVSNSTLKRASGHVRFQLGQADKFRDGIVRSGRWEDYILVCDGHWNELGHRRGAERIGEWLARYL